MQKMTLKFQWFKKHVEKGKRDKIRLIQNIYLIKSCENPINYYNNRIIITI